MSSKSTDGKRRVCSEKTTKLQSWNDDATQKHKNDSDCKSLRDGRFQGFSVGRASPSANDLSMAIDEKLLKVPLDTPDTHDARHLILHPLVQWCRTIAVDDGFS